MSLPGTLRSVAKRLAGRTFDDRRLATLARSRGLRAIVLNYHIMRRAEMQAHLGMLTDLFDLVPLDALLARSAHRLPAGARVPAALTFDDGKRSHLTEVAPALRERGLHATFFVTSGPSAGGLAHWFDVAERARQALDALLRSEPGRDPELDERRTKLAAQFETLLRRRSRPGGGAVLEVDFDRWKRMDAAHRDASVAAMADALQVGPHPEGDDERALTPEEVAALSRQGFTIGSHSRTHPILTLESEERVWDEVAASRAQISEWIGGPVAHFGYPNGNHSDATEAATRRAGYETAWVTDPLWMGGQENSHRLPRVQIFASYDRDEIALKAVLATLGVLPNPDGTGRAYRAGRKAAARRARA